MLCRMTSGTPKATRKQIILVKYAINTTLLLKTKLTYHFADMFVHMQEV